MMMPFDSEKIFWIWSDRKEREVSVRVQYTIIEQHGCRIYAIGGREEWTH